MQVRALEDGDVAAWDAYVASSPRATFFHLAGWRDVLERAYRLDCHYILAEDQDRLCGVLPLALVTRPVFGRALMSTPFCVYGGVAADSPEAETALETAARDIGRALGARYVELRYRQPPMASAPVSERPPETQFFTFRRPLAETDDGLLAAVPRKQRAVIRHAVERGDLTVVAQRDPGDFYALYRDSVHRLGTPVYRRALFEAALETFADASDILTVLRDGVPQCSVLSFYHAGEVLPYFAGSRPSARMSGAYSLMYFELMRRARAGGLKGFDFGRSIVGTGAFAYKRNWGFTPEPLAYSHIPVKAGAPAAMHPDDWPARLFAGTWRRMPRALAHRVGPLLSTLAC